MRWPSIKLRGDDMRAPPGTRADYACFTQHTTRWNDNDVYGHLNNVIHYQIFDSVVNEWLIRAGLLEPKTSELIGLVAETGCRYHGEMSYPQVITAGLRIAPPGRSSVRYEIGLFVDDRDQASAEGFLVHVYVDAQSHRPQALPDTMRDALAALITRT